MIYVSLVTSWMHIYIYTHTLLSRNQTWLAIKCSFSWMMFPSINAHLVEAFLASFDDTTLRVHPSHSSQVDGMQGWVPHQHRFALPQNPSPSSIQISSPEDHFVLFFPLFHHFFGSPKYRKSGFSGHHIEKGGPHIP